MQMHPQYFADDALGQHVGQAMYIACFAHIFSQLSSLGALSEARAKPAWTPSLNKGKPFPVKKVPVEVWAIGAFKFKGVPGVSKVKVLDTCLTYA